MTAPPSPATRSTARVRMLVIAVVAATIVLAAPPAGAQVVTEVPLGENFSIENGSECQPNAEVLVTLIDADGRERSVGSSISDRNGHFAVEAAMPATATVGPAVLSVDCGIDDALLVYEVSLVEPEAVDLASYAAYALVAAAVGLLGILAVWRLRQEPAESPAPGARLPVPAPAATAARVVSAGPAVPMAPEPAPIPPPAEVVQTGTSGEPTAGEDDDDAEYCIWENETRAGSVKRLACLSQTTFYLHEVPVTDLGSLLEQLTDVGPDVALASAFVVVPIADILEVRHGGSSLRLTYRQGNETLSRNIDLGTEVAGVVDLLGKRVHVLTDAAIPTS